jgi:hypothetical protein
MSTVSIQLTHEEYDDLHRALKMTRAERDSIQKTQNPSLLAILQARRALGMSISPRYLFSDYNPDRDEPQFVGGHGIT